MNGYGQQYGRALATARRRARLGGRRLSTQETAGITRGFAESASARLYRAKTTELQERGLTQQKKMQTERLAHMKGMQTSLFGHQTGMQTRGFEFATGEREAGQEWRAGQAAELRTFTRGESALDREQRAELTRITLEQQAREGSSQRGLQREPLGHAICIIITACTSPQSYEVNIAREYRDSILDNITLGGYYALCKVIVPLIHKSRLFKRFIKKILVDSLIDYGEVALKHKTKTNGWTSEIVSKGFLRLCHLIGLHNPEGG